MTTVYRKVDKAVDDFKEAADKWLDDAERDLQWLKDGVVVALGIVYLHVCLNLRLLEDTQSSLRSCASSSLWALFTCVGLVVVTVATMALRGVYGDALWLEIGSGLLSIGCGSVLQIASKGHGWWQSLNSRSECDVVENNVR
jgi:hypothetical protein